MTEKRKRRWLQFSLRLLLVFVLLASIGMSWVGVKMARARKQKEWVAVVEKAGGAVTYEPTEAPDWARKVLGDDFFIDVVEVYVTGEFGDNEAAYLKRLTELKSLVFKGTEITDAGLEHLEGLANLELLALNICTEITDAGLEHLKGLTNLELLALDSTKVTDAGIERLKGLNNLKSIYLTNTHVTDAGLEHLKGLTNFGVLYLDNTQVTDAGIEHLKGLTNLKHLNLNDTKITDAGLERLEGLTDLEELYVNNTQVTDAGLEHLKGLTNLDHLFLSGTQVTDAGLDKLRLALPNCQILPSRLFSFSGSARPFGPL